MKWLISLVVTSNHKCLNKVVSNITIDFNYFKVRTWQLTWYMKVKLKPHHTHAVYMHAYVDTGADVNLMPRDIYIKLYNGTNLKHLQPSDIKLGVWGDDQIALLGKCNVYLVHPDSKKSIEATFYVTDKSGSTLLSYATSLMLYTSKGQDHYQQGR